MLNIFYNIRKTPDFSGFPVILPNPNRITKKSKAQPFRLRFFCLPAKRRKRAFVSEDGEQKNGICASRAAFDFSVMARGGQGCRCAGLIRDGNTFFPSVVKITWFPSSSPTSAISKSFEIISISEYIAGMTILPVLESITP